MKDLKNILIKENNTIEDYKEESDVVKRISKIEIDNILFVEAL